MRRLDSRVEKMLCEHPPGVACNPLALHSLDEGEYVALQYSTCGSLQVQWWFCTGSMLGAGGALFYFSVCGLGRYIAHVPGYSPARGTKEVRLGDRRRYVCIR